MEDAAELAVTGNPLAGGAPVENEGLEPPPPPATMPEMRQSLTGAALTAGAPPACTTKAMLVLGASATLLIGALIGGVSPWAVGPRVVALHAVAIPIATR